MKKLLLQIISPLILFQSVILMMTGCNNNMYGLSPQSKKYIEEVLELLKSESFRKNEIEWKEFNDRVFRFAQNSRTIKNTYPAIRYAVSLLDDRHSYFHAFTSEPESSNAKPLPVLKDEVIPSGIGYIRVPFCVGDTEQTELYIKSIAGKISKQNAKNLKGWVVDLRDNFGGNMWPMIAALDPFLQAGTQGYFFDAANNSSEWSCDRGNACLDNKVLAENNNTVSLYGKHKIAVLINNKTASSGEAIAVIFKGYSNAKLFGTPTFGVSTGCETFTLSDGSRINLATSVFADRNKKKYGGVIDPDILCNENEAVEKAIKWIYDEQ